MPHSLPWLVQIAIVSKSKFVADGKAHFTALKLREIEPSYTFVIQTKVPADADVTLCLALLQALIIVRFNLHKRPENILVLVCVLVAEKNGLRLIIDTWLLQVFQGCICILAPQVLEPVNLRERDLAGTELLRFTRWLDEPRQERTIIYKWCPKASIPRYVF